MNIKISGQSGHAIVSSLLAIGVFKRVNSDFYVSI